MAVIVLRHTEPVGHQGLCYGRLDLDLRADFSADAARIAAALPRIETILTSPLSRARRLAAHIGAVRDVPVTIETDLTEMDFGTWEGRPWDAIPRTEIDAWSHDLLGARPHGGESVAMLAARVSRVLERCAPRTLVVAHAGVAKAAWAWAGAEAPWDRRLGFGDWVEIAPA